MLKMKAKILGILSGLGATLVALPALAVANYITIPTDFATTMKATVSEVFTDLTVPLVIVICLPIAFWFVAKVVGVIRGGLTARGRR
jgi:hypothetical protein